MIVTIEERVIECAKYITEKKCTVRDAAKYFGFSKSTVHKDVSERLRMIDADLYDKVKTILEINKAERHVRGGLATRRKYMKLAEKN